MASWSPLPASLGRLYLGAFMLIVGIQYRRWVRTEQPVFPIPV
jgi:hypothetical protein